MENDTLRIAKEEVMTPQSSGKTAWASVSWIGGLTVLMLALLSLPDVALAQQKARTVDDLAKMYDVASCKQCHAKVYEEWEKSTHARSLIGTGRTIGGFQGMIRAGLMRSEEHTSELQSQSN